ncbi:MAG: protein kinase [Gemmatimonadaceae bacterium]|nr:protein kinase [Gemmatimonadaceae bacterium]
MPDTKLCPQCGRTYPDADRFCTVDGAALMSSGGSDTLIGTVLAERYLVQERLGEGGMGEVFLAEHVRMKRKVAVKLMRKWMAGDPLAVSRFHREAENASQITHPNVAQVYDFGETADGTMYLAMEYVPGEPLSKILDREGRLNAVRAAEIVRQTADALVAAHAMGILHRDLKPDNVMVARARNGADIVKLVDFGIARVMNRGTQHFTSTGMIVGTPDYMSPEQLAGDTLDERSDLYALALIAFRAITGNSAFPEGASGEALIARLTNRARKLRQVLDSVTWPESLQAAFDRALDADPANRYADALEFAAELDGAVSQMPLTEEEQAYLVLLSQRMATPTRISAIHDTATPVRAMGVSPTPTPAMGQRSVALQTPPSEERAVTVPSYLRRSQAAAPLPVERPSGARGQSAEFLSDGFDDATYHESPTLAPPSADRATGEVSSGATSAVATSALDTSAAGTSAAAAPSAMPSAAIVAATAATTSSPVPAATPAAVTQPAARSSRRGPLLVIGAVALIAVGYLATRGRAPAPAQISAPAVAVSDSIVASDPSAQRPIAAPAAVVDGAAVEGARIDRARGGVFQIQSSAGRGSAFLVDPTGIVLTAASLVPSDRRVDFFLDADHTVRASVLAVDQANGVAALLISSARCTRCKTTLELGAADSTPGAGPPGDSLVALPASGRTSVGIVSAPVAKRSPRSLTLGVSLGPSSLGTPLLARRTGGVVGIATSRRGGAAGSPLRALLATARVAARTVTPNDSVYRSWPVIMVAQKDLEGAESLTEAAVTPYRMVQGGFSVMAMTPLVLAWRASQTASVSDVPPNIFAIEAPITSHVDPLSEWKEWNAYRAEHRAVVIFDISPKDAAFPAHPTKLLDWKKGDFHSMTLRRDGEILVPLESQRVPAVTNQDAYRKDGKARIPNSGVYVFHPADFAPLTAHFTMEVVDAEKQRRVNFVLPPAMLQAIAKELGPWQK